MNWQGETFKPIKQPTNFDTFGVAMVASSLLQAGAGIMAYGVAESQYKAQKAVAQANAEINKTGIMKEYTDLMKQETELLNTQKAIFAGANHSWKNSVYQEAMFNSEENFLRNKKTQAEDMARADRQAKLDIYSAKGNKYGTQGAAITGTVTNLLGNYVNYKLYTRGDK